MMPRLRYWRTVVPALALGLFVLLVLRLRYPLPADAAVLAWLSRLDPLLALRQSLLEGGLVSWAWLPGLVLLITLLGGRVFCGWLCPMGALLNLLHSLREALGKRWPGARRVQAVLSWPSYTWLAVVVALLVMGSSLPLALTPFSLLGHEVTRLWMGRVPWVLLLLAAVGVAWFPRAWCTYACPTGLALAAVARLRWWRLRAGGECTSCRACQRHCPVGALRGTPAPVGEQCVLCGRCWEDCPRGAMEWQGGWSAPPEGAGADPQWTRRQLVGGAAAGLLGLALWQQLGEPAVGAPLRPPGGQDELDFAARCLRCGRCVKVCPTRALEPMPLASGLLVFDTPEFIPRQGRCELCMLCQQVCPTQAIRPVPLERLHIGTAVIDRTRCLNWIGKTKCLLCAEQCPLAAIAIDGRERPHVDEGLCVGCGACENGCPVEGEAAVRVYPRSGSGQAGGRRRRGGWQQAR